MRLRPFDIDPATRSRLWDAPRGRTLIDVIAGPLDVAPEAPILALTAHGVETEWITWRAIWEGAAAQAAALRDRGVDRGDRVVVMLPTSRAFVDAFFGTLLAGAIPVPIAPPPSGTVDRLAPHLETVERIARDCGAAAVVGVPRTLETVGAWLSRRCPGLALVAPVAADARGIVADWRPRPEDTALIQYTSGSTSDPKGVELSHANIVANAEAIARTIAHPWSCGVSWLPLHHDMGLIGVLLTGLYSRTPAVHLPPRAFVKTPAVWLRAISEVGATITVAPNFAFEYCVRTLPLDGLADVSLATLELAMNGAEPIDAAALAAFEEKYRPLGLRSGIVRPVYGLAESSLAVTFAKPGPPLLDDVDADRLEREEVAVRAAGRSRAAVFVSVGCPVPGHEIRIVNAEDRELGERQIGEVVVRGPSVMRGYFGRPSDTAAALRGGWLHTGDLGYLAAGQLFITGRLKDVIIRHGKNYHAEDIERRVRQVTGVLPGMAAAFGIDNGPSTTVVVVAETRMRGPEATEMLARRIREECHAGLLFGPDVVHLVPPGSIPRTTSGKIRRQACKRWYLESAPPQGSSAGVITDRPA